MKSENVKNLVREKVKEEFKMQILGNGVSQMDESLRGKIAGTVTGLGSVFSGLGLILGGAMSTFAVGSFGLAAGLIVGGGILFVGGAALGNAVRKGVEHKIMKGMDKKLIGIVQERDKVIEDLMRESDADKKIALTEKLQDLTKKMQKIGTELLNSLVQNEETVLEKISKLEYDELVKSVLAAKAGTLTNVKQLIGKTLSTR